MSFTPRFTAATAAIMMLTTAAFAEDPRIVTERFYTLLDDPDAPLTDVAAIISDDYVDHDRNPTAPADLSDKQVTLGLFNELRVGFPDMVHKLDIVEDISENRVMVYWTFNGTHDGTFFGVPASGNPIQLNGVDILKIEGGLITEHWHVEELLGMFQQMGAAE